MRKIIPILALALSLSANSIQTPPNENTIEDDWIIIQNPQNPLILVPGIGGSMLRTSTDQTPWIGLQDLLESLANYETDFSWLPNLSDSHFRKYLLGKFDGQGGITTVFTKDEITVPYSLSPDNAPAGTTCRYNSMLAGLCGIDFVIDIEGGRANSVWNEIVQAGIGAESFDVYGKMIQFFSDKGYTPGVDLFGFPYDWRLSNRQDETLQRLDRLLLTATNNGARKASIISHSMGSLVIRLYAASFPDNATKYIKKWIAIGGPFQGAAGNLLAGMFSGYNLGDLVVCNCTVRELSVQSAAGFELLASNWLETKLEPMKLTTRWEGGQKTFTGRKEILELAKTAYANNTFSYDKTTVAWPMSQQAADWALTTRKILDRTSNFPKGIQVYVIYGKGVDTPYHPTYTVSGPNFEPSELLCAKNGCKQNSCIKATTECTPTMEFVDGDGTVPALSASHPFGETNPFPITKTSVSGVEHQHLIKNKQVFQTVLSWLAE